MSFQNTSEYEGYQKPVKISKILKTADTAGGFYFMQLYLRNHDFNLASELS
jgi:hypothetical protein